MVAALCIMAASIASDANAFCSLAFCCLYRQLAFSTCRRWWLKAHSALVIPPGCSFSGFPFFFGVRPPPRRELHTFSAQWHRGGVSARVGKRREWSAML
jgi:hypothetical protein